ncbi:unnamed protein product [Adineta steineri]|uniref:Uncharacterized protein n=1 Tax=Adineta steineri TaxID=433720 RepID=A0A815ZGP8_9BILA|nr:unnamed protein product [Adineta steineri]CAF1582265.1 unnamed protein product [Adineta steineri]
MLAMIWIFIVLIGIASVEGRTNASGVLLVNTIWSIAKSPIYITGNIGVPDNVRLTIEAGVQVIFPNNGNYQILVKGGSLTVRGSSKSSVRFIAQGLSDSNCMITFKGSQLSKSSFSYAYFEGPKGAICLQNSADGLPQNAYTVRSEFVTFNRTTILAAGDLNKNGNNSKQH